MLKTPFVLTHAAAMPKTVPQSELDAVVQAVGALAPGAAIEDIRRALDIDLPRRTLQRRLSLLTEQGRLISEGSGRGCRYYLPGVAEDSGSYIPRALNKKDVLQRLARLKPELVRRFGVTRMAVFGSTVRDEAQPDSDVDVLVAFEGPATSARYFGVQFLLEDSLGRAVDLVTDKAVRPELRPYIEREAINV
jgi:predicted nucleotidyltransferase